MIPAKIQADSVEDSLLVYSCQSLDGGGDFVSLAIRFPILCEHIIIIITRPKPAYGRQGLDWIVGPGYSFVVFSTNKTMETNQNPKTPKVSA